MKDILDMEGWSLTDKRTEGLVETFSAEYVHEPIACSKCGGIKLYRHGTKKTTYADAPLRGFAAKLEATVRRYRCRDCGETFLQPLGGVLDERRMTVRCAEFIAKQALKHTFVHVAREVGIDEKTVRAVAAERMAELQSSRTIRLPRVLGVDETMIHKVQRLVLTDIEARRLLDMYPRRDDGALEVWLGQFRDLSAVKVVTMDMWRPYQRTVSKLMPQAAIVVDKFHVVRYANFALETVRIRLGKAKQTEVRRFWVRSKVQLNKRARNLTEKQRFNLSMWLDNEPELAEAYRLKEALYDLYDLPKEQAEAAFDAFIANVPPTLKKDFGELTRLMKNWRAEILAYFDHPYTNAYTEAVNGLMKHIARAGRGYSYEVLRARILATAGAPERKPLFFEFLLKDDGNPCANCGLPCRAEDMHLVTLPPVTRGQRAKRALVCDVCESRFNTEKLIAHRKASTRKTG
ncbi:ISL3 family transposase [Burkholderia sp. AU45388]|uniref:ISL3 family transposase n=1 Tax=Burkholderia sp. AU45388 TaxID=3059206 RepID=UPI002651CFDE|nr:ISL3 family transposase [Burkholderia sp. AU45388]MDN7429030.1 ISL3 family transposase [Burkholderia sp. AU45388]